MMRHGTRTPVVRYGLGGVQSVPRVMRGSPAARGSIVDVPLSKRDLAGLESQGLARTVGGLGSLGGCTLGDEEIEMPAECMRRGEIMLPDGSCGPDPRQPINPYASPSQLAPTNVNLTVKSPMATSVVAQGMSRQTMVLLGAVAIVAGIGLLYMDKRR